MLKQFKSLILFSSILLLIFSSCKKDKEDTVELNTISVSVDGSATSFDVGAKATVLSVSGGYGISIQGNKKDPSASQTMLSFSITSPDVITPKTYVENAGGNPLIIMEYFFDAILGIGTTSSAYGSATHPVTITITEINSSFVKGTFSGELSYTDLAGNPAKNILTNGVFNVHF